MRWICAGKSERGGRTFTDVHLRIFTNTSAVRDIQNQNGPNKELHPHGVHRNTRGELVRGMPLASRGAVSSFPSRVLQIFRSACTHLTTLSHPIHLQRRQVAHRFRRPWSQVRETSCGTIGKGKPELRRQSRGVRRCRI